MKRILSIISVFALLLTSCVGEQGPPGFDGYDGEVARSFEIELDFNNTNNYEFVEPYGFNISISDVTLVYVLWETFEGQDIWRLMPQTVPFDDGNLVYNYDFTQTDVRFFLEGSTDFSFLDSSYTQNQVFRVVVVPATNLGRGDNISSIDYNDLDTIMELYNITEFPRR